MMISESVPQHIVVGIRRTMNYVNRRRQDGLHGTVTEDGIEVTLANGVVDAIRSWNEEVLRHRKDANEMHNDTGGHRLDEGVLGKLAEISCRIAGPIIPVERETGEFVVNYDIIKKGHVGYDCDLNDSVTVKTSGCYGGHISWLASSDDVVRSNPDGIRIILCKSIDKNKFLIMGWVWASDLYGRWNDPLLPSMNRKQAIYYKSGDKIHNGRTISVFGGGVEEVMHPITEV